ncbi:MAG: response regulator [Methanomicrobiaceae archaeon]|nr:response regulator [Methanomicrobiaceae archaeon]
MTGKKILLIEDSFDIAEMVTIILEREGYIITDIVESGEKALVSAAASHPDAVISDINLAGNMDGIETASYLSHLFRIPIIFMTGILDNDIISRAKSAEPYGYLLKPFKKQELVSTVSVAIRAFELNTKVQGTYSGNTPLSVKHMSSHDEGIMIADNSGRILYVNPYIENLTGYTNADTIFRPVSDILSISQENDPERFHENITSGEESTVLLNDRSGGTLTVRIRIVPRKYRDEDTIGVIISLREIPVTDTAEAKDSQMAYKPEVPGVAA